MRGRLRGNTKTTCCFHANNLRKGEKMSETMSPVPYTGNKGCIYQTIDAFMPPHKTYLEACMGSAEVFLRKRPVDKEIINDFNGDLVKFFRVLQRNEKLAYLVGRLYFSFNSEALFRANKNMLAGVPNILDDITETAVMIENAEWEDIELAVAFLENQIFSFSSTGKTFAIAKKDMTKRFGRLVAACCRLRNAIIMHRDYKDAINYAAGKNTFILLDPPYKGTEKYYQKSGFDSTEHDNLFEFMNSVHEKFKGECKFLITYNNDPYIKGLADKYGFDTYVQTRLHNMTQGTRPGEMFEELLIANYPLLKQADENNKFLAEQTRQLSLFDYHYDY
jgi:DNA adenine methylase